VGKSFENKELNWGGGGKNLFRNGAISEIEKISKNKASSRGEK